MKKIVGFIAIFIILLSLSITGYAGIDDYPAEYKSADKDALVDRWNFYNRECTSFVAWCLNSRNGVDFHNWYGGVQWGNADNWGEAAKSLGIPVDNVPAVGAVAWWSSKHVAWVEAVEGSHITIEEYNKGGTGLYKERTISASGPTGYIHIKDIASPPPITLTDTSPKIPVRIIALGIALLLIFFCILRLIRKAYKN